MPFVRSFRTLQKTTCRTTYCGKIFKNETLLKLYSFNSTHSLRSYASDDSVDKEGRLLPCTVTIESRVALWDGIAYSLLHSQACLHLVPLFSVFLFPVQTYFSHEKEFICLLLHVFSPFLISLSSLLVSFSQHFDSKPQLFQLMTIHPNYSNDYSPELLTEYCAEVASVGLEH
jgi:hypothetical protein